MVGSVMNSNTDTVPLDVALSMAANDQRRAILRYLLEADDDLVSIDDLVHEVAGNGADSRQSAHSTPQQVQVSVQHTHLPKLAEAGIVEYDTRSDTVRYYSDAGIERLVRFLSEQMEINQ